MSALIASTVTNGLAALAVFAEEKEFDENSVTPGVVGFFAIFVVAALIIFIGVDMVRRVRRTRYRAEIRERLAAERSGGDTGEPSADGQTSATNRPE